MKDWIEATKGVQVQAFWPVELKNTGSVSMEDAQPIIADSITMLISLR